MEIKDYMSIGFNLIPLEANSKKPLNKCWHKKQSLKNKQLLNVFKNDPSLNVGLLLGRFLDIESDDLSGNILLEELLGNYPHPRYKSSKSVHHLFINPYPNLTRRVFKGIEFRGYKHQSVLPPSIHPDGTQYEWVDFNGGEFPLPPLSIIKFLRGRGIVPAGRYEHPWCAVCGDRVLIHRRRFRREIEIFHSIGQRWKCENCRDGEFSRLYKKSKALKNREVKERKKNFKKQEKIVPREKIKRPEISSLRQKLLNKPGKGEREFKVILDVLREIYGKKLLKYKWQRLFIVPEAREQMQFFFNDFFIYPFRCCVEIDGKNHGDYMQSQWDDWRTGFLAQHKNSVLRLPSDDVINHPEDVVVTLLEHLCEFDGQVGKLLKGRINETPVYLAQAAVGSRWRKLNFSSK